jgi:segregation and condensation protein B
MKHGINLFENTLGLSTEEKEETPGDVQKSKFFQPLLPGIGEKLQEKQNKEQIKRIIEALLFASSEPIGFNKIREITDTIYPLKPSVLRELVMELGQEYMVQQRSFRLEEIAQGYIIRTCEEYSSYIELMLRNKRTEKLSQAAAETLAIIAYRQPITRPQIDAIRGVDSSGIIYSLLERQLITPVGKLEAPGRPTLYGITKEFLAHFGLRDIKDLPPLEEGS